MENLGRESVISKFLIWGRGGGKFGVENAVSNLEFGGVENLGWKVLSRISNFETIRDDTRRIR